MQSGVRFSSPYMVNLTSRNFRLPRLGTTKISATLSLLFWGGALDDKSCGANLVEVPKSIGVREIHAICQLLVEGECRGDLGFLYESGIRGK